MAILLKKYTLAFIYFSVCITSSLYHACKFGSVGDGDDFRSNDGMCLFLTFSQYYIMDHFFAILTVPALFVTLTGFDITLFDFSTLSRIPLTVNKLDKLSMQHFALDNLFDPSYFTISSSITTREYYPDDKHDIIYFNKIPNNIDTGTYNNNSNNNDINNQKVLWWYYVLQNHRIKTNASGLENCYIFLYAYVIGFALLLSGDPSYVFYGILLASCILNVLIWNIYYYIEHNMIVVFRLLYFVPGLLLAALAITLMLLQTHVFPSTSYWVVHSLWHISGGLGQYFLLKSKYRYCSLYKC